MVSLLVLTIKPGFSNYGASDILPFLGATAAPANQQPVVDNNFRKICRHIFICFYKYN